MTVRSGDDRLVRRAARRLVLQSSVSVAAAMLALIAVVSAVVVHGQQATTDALLTTTARTVDDVGDPPAGAWVLIAASGHITASPGLPTDLSARLAGLRTALPGRVDLRTVTDDDGDIYRILTRQRPAQPESANSLLRVGHRIQVILDLRPQQQQRAQLLRTMAEAAGLSLLLSAGLGMLLGRRAVRPLAHALQLQRTFVADASHELRTPLTLLSTRAQLLDRQVATLTTDPQLRQDSAGIVGDVHRLGGVVEDLLIAADPRQDQHHHDVDLAALAADVADSSRAHAEHTGVQLAVSAGPGPSAATVPGSPAALRRALLALLDNAIDHTPPGGTVGLDVVRRRRTVTVTVTDTGPGISREQAEQVLRRFHSGGQRAGRAHYGLGLALTHDVANRHGGHLRLAPPRPDTGASFELELPTT